MVRPSTDVITSAVDRLTTRGLLGGHRTGCRSCRAGPWPVRRPVRAAALWCLPARRRDAALLPCCGGLDWSSSNLSFKLWSNLSSNIVTVESCVNNTTPPPNETAGTPRMSGRREQPLTVAGRYSWRLCTCIGLLHYPRPGPCMGRNSSLHLCPRPRCKRGRDPRSTGQGSTTVSHRLTPTPRDGRRGLPADWLLSEHAVPVR